jgi:UTP--glucose-1-phosphate uridylyltransferase
MSEMIFVTGRNKRPIEDHFDKAFELEAELEQRGNKALLQMVRNIIPRRVSCVYLRQPQALGLGHAILCAASVVGNAPFAIVLADDLIDAEPPVLRQMADVFVEHDRSVVAVQNVARSETRQYGIVKLDSRKGSSHRIAGIVEKPAPSEAPSTLGVVGRYILTPRIFDHLRRVKPGAGGEIQLTDGIAALLKEEEVLAYEFAGTRYDCGSKVGYLKANIAFALKHPEVAQELRQYMKTVVPRSGG